MSLGADRHWDLNAYVDGSSKHVWILGDERQDAEATETLPDNEELVAVHEIQVTDKAGNFCLLYTSPSPRDS